MSKMLEIYKKHVDNYDELVNAEDCQDNLGFYLKNEVNWDNKSSS